MTSTPRDPRREGTPVARRGGPARPKPPQRPQAARTQPRPAGRPAARPVSGPRRVLLGRPRLRLQAGMLAVLMMLSLIGGRLVWLQGFQAEALASEAVKQRLSTVTLAAPRGRILDRDGEVMALSVDARAIYGEPRTIAQARCRPDATKPCDPAGIAAALAPVLGLPAEEIESKLVLTPKATGSTCSETELIGCKGFAYLARGLEADKANEVRDLGLVGIGTIAEPRRVAPGGEVGANVLGFTTVEGKGTAGVEMQFDEVLAGINGKRVAEVDGGGRIIPNGYTSTVEPKPGRDVQLTIDRDLQWTAQQVLAEQIEEFDAYSGSATLMDITTGEVLAQASVPTFDANEPGKTDAEFRGNTAITDVFEPGSIGKAITAAAVLEAGALTPDSVLTVPDRIRVSNGVFSDSHPDGTDQMTYTGVLVKSSNVGTIMAAQKLAKPTLHEMLQRFGIGAKTGIELPKESRGILRNEKDEWSGTDYATHPIGYGYAVNGVQMASVYATIANGGLRVKPTIVKATTDLDGAVVPAQRRAPERVIDQRVADQLRGMLEGVTNEGGTAVSAAIPGYRIAGKTGTARRNINGTYDGYTASFVGFAPADKPRLVLSVSIQDPKNGYYGGVVAGPVFRDIMSAALFKMKVPPTGAPSPVLRLYASDPH